MSYPRKIRRILLYGRDARTDALAAACRRSEWAPELIGYSDYAVPGLLDKCRHVRVGSLADLRQMVAYASEVEPDVVVIGPEEPLELGLADALGDLGIPCFGPRRDLARIETSKSWTRELLDRNQIEGNPRYRVFRAPGGLEAYLEELGDFVIKPDGLTGGKGVRVFGEHLSSAGAALEYAAEMIESHGCVVIEERLVGQEFSLQTITDGSSVLHCPVVQDHKRAFEGDRGPNTGGMGSYSCPDGSLPFLVADEVAAARLTNELVIEALLRESGGIPYRGVLYGGFMATPEGLRLIEYNARFGDPEAMNVLPILDGDFVELCAGVVEARLGEVDARFAPKATVCKYVVPEAYPEGKGKGDPIRLREEMLEIPDLHFFWAATERRGSEIFLTGSRALACTGVADTLADAERLAEFGASAVEGEVRHRRDIGTSEAIEARVAHMRSLREGRKSRDG